MNILKAKHGYTLIELLIVVFIWSLFVSFLPTLMTNLKEKTDARYYLTLLQEDLYLAQQWAMTKQVPVTFTYMNTSNLYLIRENNGNVIIRRELPANARILQNSMNSFRYTINGTINSFGTIYYRVDDLTYRIVVNIGRGRFQIYDPVN